MTTIPVHAQGQPTTINGKKIEAGQAIAWKGGWRVVTTDPKMLAASRKLPASQRSYGVISLPDCLPPPQKVYYPSSYVKDDTP